MENGKDEGYLCCPHCGETKLASEEYYKGIALVKKGSDGKFKYYYQKKDSKPSHRILGCLACHAELSEEELIEGVKCVKCGRTTIASDIDENGVCTICRAEEANPMLMSMSRDELIRLVAKYQFGAAPSAVKKAKEKVEKMPEPEEIPDDTKKTKKSPKKVTRKKKDKQEDTQTQETPSEEPVQDTVPAEDVPTDEPQAAPEEQVPTEEVKDAEQQIAEQNAPFPDMSGFGDLFDGNTSQENADGENVQPVAGAEGQQQSEQFDLYEEQEAF